MPPTIRSVGTAHNSGTIATQVFTPPMPAGIVAGDLLIGFAANGTGSIPSARPTGSTAILNVDDGTVWHCEVVRKIAVGGDTFTWNATTSSKWAGGVIAVQTGTFDTTTPISAIIGTAQGTTASNAFATGSTTPASADTLALAFFGQQGAATWTCTNVNPSMTELIDTTSTGTAAASCAVYRSATAPPAALYSRTGTASLSSANGGAGLLHVNPSAGGTVILRRPRRPGPNYRR